MTFAATLHAIAAERVAARDIDVDELIAERRERREQDSIREFVAEQRGSERRP